MFTRKSLHLFFSLVLVATLLLGACTRADTTQPTEAPQPPADTVEPTAEPAAAETSPLIAFDPAGVATGFWVDVVPAATEDPSRPYWGVAPEFSRATLDGYTINGHLMQPQVFVYPLEELAATNEAAATVIASLRTLLDSPQEIEHMPLLPLFNAAQVLHTQVQYLDFQNGRGVRYLAFLSQGIVPVNNHELFYTYQGITNDGKYYVAAILPVNHPLLPADGTVTGNEPAEFSSDFRAYIANTARSLNVQAADTFSPDLTLLDAMMASLEVK